MLKLTIATILLCLAFIANAKPAPLEMTIEEKITCYLRTNNLFGFSNTNVEISYTINVGETELTQSLHRNHVRECMFQDNIDSCERISNEIPKFIKRMGEVYDDSKPHPAAMCTGRIIMSALRNRQK